MIAAIVLLLAMEVAFCEEISNCACVPQTQCSGGNTSPLLDVRVHRGRDPLVCCSNSHPSEMRDSPEKPVPCGVRDPGGLSEQKGTEEIHRGTSEFGEWPWQVAFMLKKTVKREKPLVECGGVLIDNKHVLTAGYCVRRSEAQVVRIGEWDAEATIESLPHYEEDVKNVTIHPNANRDSLNPFLYSNDIAIVTLAKPVNFGANIAPICLPMPEEDFFGQKCVVTGWGSLNDTATLLERKMKENPVRIVGGRLCQNSLRQIIGKSYKLFNGSICAKGNEGADSSPGDGGSPLACLNEHGTYSLVGLVSYGGVDPSTASVYVDVSKYMEWIASVTGTPLEQLWQET